MRRILLLEMEQNIKKVGIIVSLFVLLLAVLINQVGIKNYHMAKKQQQEFVESERKAFESFFSYRQYGAFGFQVMMMPSPLSIIAFNSKAFNDLIGMIDTGARLRLEESKIGPNAFSRSTGTNIDLSWFLLVFGSLLVMLWFFFSFRDKKYLKYILNFTSRKTAFLSIIFARLFILAAYLLLVFIVTILQFRMNHIILSLNEYQHLLVFFGLLFLVLSFFALISASLGTLSTVKGALSIAFIWLIVVLLWPEVINLSFSIQSQENLKGMSKIEAEKLNIISEKIEKVVLKNTQRYQKPEDKVEEDRKGAERYWNYVFKDVEDIDARMIDRTETIVRDFQFICIINPVTFIKSAGNEISSQGYNSYIQMYRDNKAMRKGFLRFITNNRYYKNYSKVYPFVSAEKALMPVKPQLPYYFLYGLLFIFIYITLVGMLAYRQFKRQLFPRINQNVEFYREFSRGNVSNHEHKPYILNLQTTKLLRLSYDRNNQIKAVITNFLSGTMANTLVTHDEKDINGMKMNVHYIPDPEELSLQGSIDRLYKIAKLDPPQDQKGKNISQLNRLEKINMLLDIAMRKKVSLYILDNFSNQTICQDLNQITTKIEILKKSSAVIEFSEKENKIYPDYWFEVFQDENKFIFLRVISND
ncbi:MAG: hypothetical protein ACM3SY_17490 [Candidatus Omnitrophota bacterium]